MLRSSTQKTVLLSPAFTAVNIPAVEAQQSTKSIQTILETGVHPDTYCASLTKMTALYYAAWHGNAESVNLLLEHKADPNLVNLDGNNMTALHVAAQQGSAIIVSALLKAGANPGIVTQDNTTAIELAVMNYQWDCVKAFAESGISDSNGAYRYDYALFIAVETRQFDIAIALIPLCYKCPTLYYVRDINSPFYQFNVLHFAAYYNNSEFIKSFFLNKKINIPQHTRTAFNKTAVQIAAEKKHWACVIEFIEGDKTKESFDIVLRLAVNNNEVKIVDKLLKTINPDNPITATEYIAKQPKTQPNEEKKEEANLLAGSLFHNLDRLDNNTKISFQRLEHIMQSQDTPTETKAIIVTHFNDILAKANREDTSQILINIFNSKQSLQFKLTKLKKHSPSTISVLKALETLFVNIGNLSILAQITLIIGVLFSTSAVAMHMLIALTLVSLIQIISKRCANYMGNLANEYCFFNRKEPQRAYNKNEANLTHPLNNIFTVTTPVNS